MNTMTLTLDNRTIAGKKVRRVRERGVTPSVVYGASIDTKVTQSPTPLTAKVVQMAGKHTPVTLTIDGKSTLAIIKSIDRDPVKRNLRHVAFHAIKQDEVITTEVPITLLSLGESAAERAGLVVLQALEHVEVKAKPADLPEELELSVVSLEQEGDKLTLAEIILPTGVSFADQELDLEAAVATVYEPGALQAANEAAGGAAEEGSAEDVASEHGSEAETSPAGE
ncbi:MAG: 50S ribosomal protein L25 [Candidatus Saccharimonadales bacterium]